MVWSLLTSVIEIVTRADESYNVELIEAEASMSRQVLLQTALHEDAVTGSLHTIGMREIRNAFALQQIPKMGLIFPEERRNVWLRTVEDVTTEEVRRIHEAGLPPYEAGHKRSERMMATRKHKRLADVEQLMLTPPTFGRVDLTVEALLESYLWINLHDQTILALLNIMQASEAKSIFIQNVGVSIGFQRIMIQWYMPYYMEMPAKHNLLGITVTPLTLPLMKGMNASSYIAVSMQEEDIATKALILPVTDRSQRAKVLATGKSGGERLPTVSHGKEHEPIDMNAYIPLFHDIQGKDFITVTIFQAMMLRYLIKVWGARMVGYPEGYAYWQYPHIAVIITRRGVKIRYKGRFLVPQWAAYIRDTYVANMRKFREVHGFHRTKHYAPPLPRHYDTYSQY